MECRGRQAIVRKTGTVTVSYAVEIPCEFGDGIIYYHVDVEQDERGLVHSLKISSTSMLENQVQLSNGMLKALFELFRREKLCLEAEENGGK
ncbi:MAG: hypothetical protein QXO47_10800 [Thermoproteota archaeon]